MHAIWIKKHNGSCLVPVLGLHPAKKILFGVTISDLNRGCPVRKSLFQRFQFFTPAIRAFDKQVVFKRGIGFERADRYFGKVQSNSRRPSRWRRLFIRTYTTHPTRKNYNILTHRASSSSPARRFAVSPSRLARASSTADVPERRQAQHQSAGDSPRGRMETRVTSC